MQDEELRLALLAHKRATVVALRDAPRMDDSVLRQVQACLEQTERRVGERQVAEGEVTSYTGWPVFQAMMRSGKSAGPGSARHALGGLHFNMGEVGPADPSVSALLDGKTLPAAPGPVWRRIYPP